MTDRILIRGLRELGVHGVLPEEQVRPQPFQVDLELLVDTSAAGKSDDLDDTVDYSAVCDAVGRVVASESYALLERLAARIAEVCRGDDRVAGVGRAAGEEVPAAFLAVDAAARGRLAARAREIVHVRPHCIAGLVPQRPAERLGVFHHRRACQPLR